MVSFSGISSRSILAVIVLVMVAGAAAYYYLVYLPETESKPATVVQATAKPTTAAKKPVNVSKPSGVQNPPIASAVPAIPVAVAPASVPVKPVLDKQPTPVSEQKSVKLKPEPAAQKPVQVKRKTRSQTVKKAKASQTRLPEKPQQMSAPIPAVISEPVAIATSPTINVPKYNDMLTAALRGDKDAVQQLLDLGRWVDKPGASGLTPLMGAVMNRDIQMAQLLLEHGADPTAQTLKLAQENKDAAMVSLLQQHIKR